MTSCNPPQIRSAAPHTAVHSGLRVLADLPTEVLSQPGKASPTREHGPSRVDLTGRLVSNIQIESLIGAGGMGAVYRGFDRTLRRNVAVKTLREERRTAANRARFMREARILSRLDHPTICQVYELVSWRNRDLLVLELINGETLGRAAGRLNIAEKLRVAEAVATANSVAHREHIMHRDLKPDNIMITTQGEVKVLDFGIARSAAPDDATTLLDTPTLERTPRSFNADAGQPSLVTETFGTAGTLAYMSPEQARSEPLTLATDLFSFGVVLQELFTDRRATPNLPMGPLIAWVGAGKSLPAEGIDRDVARLIADLRHPIPAERPTAERCLSRIRHLIAKPELRRRRWQQGLAAAGLVAVLGLAFLLARGAGDTQARDGAAPQTQPTVMRGALDAPCCRSWSNIRQARDRGWRGILGPPA